MAVCDDSSPFFMTESVANLDVLTLQFMLEDVRHNDKDSESTKENMSPSWSSTQPATNELIDTASVTIPLRKSSKTSEDSGMYSWFYFPSPRWLDESPPFRLLTSVKLELLFHCWLEKFQIRKI